MKTITAILLVLAMSCPPTPKAKAATLPMVCLCVTIGIAATVAYGIKIFAERCETHPYCYRDPETSQQYCRNLTKKAAKCLGTNIVSGPFDGMPPCEQNCSTNHPAGMQSAGAQSANDYSDGTAWPYRIMVQKTTGTLAEIAANTAIWEDVADVDLDSSLERQDVYEDLEMSSRTAFYRFRHD